jgi:hypothetical protein
MFRLRGEIRVTSYSQQSFQIQCPKIKDGGVMSVYASEHLFSRLAEMIEANLWTSGMFIISGRVLIHFKLGKDKAVKEARDER